MKTRKGILKLVDIIRDIWENLTGPEKDDGIKVVKNLDTENFRKILIKIQNITGTITENEEITKNPKRYKINNIEKIRGEGDSHTKGREERD